MEQTILHAQIGDYKCHIKLTWNSEEDEEQFYWVEGNKFYKTNKQAIACARRYLDKKVRKFYKNK